MFASYHPRDAIVNADSSFTSLIVMQPRLPFGAYGQFDIIHNGESFYSGLPNPLSAGRYHSLYVESDSLPDCLEVTAKTDAGLIMGLRHKTLPVASVQFHPESILTLKDQTGLRMINKMLGEMTGN